MRGLPDWGRPLDRGGGRAWAAFEADPGAVALPDTLMIADGPDGRPAFHLSAVRPLVPLPGRRGYGRLDIEFRLAATGAAADGTTRAAPALRGWLRLGAGALSLPEALTAPAELDCSGLGLARLVLPLASEEVTLIERAIEDGTAPVLATVDVEVAGVAARLPGRAMMDLARLRSALGNGTMMPSALAAALAADPAALGVALEGGLADLPSHAVAAAVADHIRARLCAGPLRPAGDAGLALVMSETGIAHGTAVLDLSEPVMATRPLTIGLDPFAAARELASARGGVAALITRTRSAALQSGRHEIVIDASAPRPCAGPLALGASLAFPPRPPARTHEVREDFELPATGEGVSRQVRLAPTEPLAWALTGFAYWPTTDGRGVERLDGPRRDGEGARALLRPDSFPLSFFEVEAGAALLAGARVEVAAQGSRGQDGGDPARAAATLAAGAPRVALALPADARDPVLSADLVSRDGGARIALPPRPASDWRIELSDAPGYGPRAVEIAVALPAGVPLLAVEVLAEDSAPDAEPDTYAFTPSAPVRTHRWLCRDPFRPGLRWRWRADPPAAFSEPVPGVGRIELSPEAVPA